MLKPKYNPDVLSCLSNLSNDEVFTPPDLANALLDTLPKEIWQNKKATFLDPCCKSGVFLREIAKRLIVGLKEEIPDEQQRIDHIFKNQIYGISITEMTGLLSRRSVYCSKHANGKYSVCTKFTDECGNIIFNEIKHTFKNGRCVFCGAAESEYGEKVRVNLESHAYQFIHTLNAEEIFNMKFDVIIGNPPYQLNTGGTQAQAIPLYHKFVMQAQKLNPRYLVMITPSCWFTGGFGLDAFRDKMLNDKRLRIIHDYFNASDCFAGVEIKGGVCYFLWDRENEGLCTIFSHINNRIESVATRPLLEEGQDVFIRYNRAVPILKKIKSFSEKSFSDIISSQRPFGLPTNFTQMHEENYGDEIKVYANKKRGYLDKGYIITKNVELIDQWKIYTPKAIGTGDGLSDYVKPIIGEPYSICTETYVAIGPFETEQIAKNVCSYINTKFFHFLLTLKKNTQDALAKVYQFIPMQDFSKPLTAEFLYAKYCLTDEEIDFIESMIRPME